MSDALQRLGAQAFEATESLDDGTPIVVSIVVNDGRAVVDFTGTGQTHAGNLNATPAIVRSAVMYVMRLLINDPVPLNEGVMRRITIHLPEKTILNPRFDEHDAMHSPAVVGGNVETSQRVVDTLIKALGIMACGQGTMNNVLFGNEAFGYYETIGGGSGAGPGFDGAAGLHVHMTNTRLTDPEVLEHRYPVRVIRHEIRRGSGGDGEFRGGDGVTRELEFTEAVELSVLTQHRTVAPYGMNGGSDGAVGRQYVLRTKADGETETTELDSIDACDVQAGDRLTIETPGGGGYGAPPTNED
jgi:5-oxoprolinase (ATP-hydrolysing)